MKTLVVTFSATLLLAACGATTKASLDIESNRANQQTIEVSALEKTQLTYRFKDSLIADEQEALYEYLGTAKSIETLSPVINNALNATKGFAYASSLYTQNLEKAVASGNLMELFGPAAIAGATFALLTPSKERHRRDFDLTISREQAINLTSAEITKIKREETYEAIRIFAKENNYSLKCIEFCSNTTTEDSSGKSSFLLTLIGPTDGYQPKYLYVQTTLTNLKRIEKPVDSIFLGEEYLYKSELRLGWLIALTSTYNDSEPKFVTLDKRQYLTGVNTLIGTTVYRKFYEYLTKEIKGFSHYRYTHHSKYAFYDGETYLLNDKLTNNSIIKSKVL